MERARPGDIRTQRRLLADDVFHRIAEEILGGELAEGAMVRDHELADRLNVSRTPVREALMRLERIGLVEIEPSRFTRVTVVTPEVIRQHRELAGLMAGAAARMAVPRLTEDQLARALELVDAVAAALPDPRAASRARHQLFSYLSDNSGNRAHHALMADVEIALTRSLGRMRLRPLCAPEEEHAACADMRAAIAARDAEEIERVIRLQHGIR